MLRMSLFFMAAAVVSSLIAAPLLERRTDLAASGLDSVSTGSIGRSGTYTVRKSVLQPSPDSVCIIRDRDRAGDC